MATQLDIDRGQQTKLIALAKTCRDLEQRLQKAAAAKQPTDDRPENCKGTPRNARVQTGAQATADPKLGQVLGEP
ncbi:hypothetical protein [Rosistilla oblonga]|uniref:hypothetical protein n=1 Tax=Rosistilla oblonga TaxID=2527990 RepID=UPI003A973FF0